MKHAESKMMDRIAEIENYVLGGLVLDDRGRVGVHCRQKGV
jgi:hypothetical protein